MYPLVMTNSLLLKMAPSCFFDLPIKDYDFLPIYNIYMVGGWPTPLIIWKSVGVMIPNWMEKVPNHQPDIYIYKHHVSHENDRICVQTGNIFTMNKTLWI